ncbi:MAG: peptidase S58 family protein, partial [Actinobacteria bacterium]
MNDTITAVPGVMVGHYTDLAAATGTTVLTFAEP